MAIGGFNGSDPSPTLAQFQQYVAEGKIHFFIAGGGMGGGMNAEGTATAISTWVTENFTATTVEGVTPLRLDGCRLTNMNARQVRIGGAPSDADLA